MWNQFLAKNRLVGLRARSGDSTNEKNDCQQFRAATTRCRSLARAQLQHPDSTCERPVRMCWKVCNRACGGDGYTELREPALIPYGHVAVPATRLCRNHCLSGHAWPPLSGTLLCRRLHVHVLVGDGSYRRLHVEWIAIEHGQQCIGHVVVPLSRSTSASLSLVAARIPSVRAKRCAQLLCARDCFP
jgi:hypothetical protein